MAEGSNNGKLDAALFGIWATFALDVFSTLNSSPQTTELFAKDREDSLMHWVVIGDAVAVAGGALWAYKARNVWPLVAVVTVVLGMHVAYRHAVSRGQDKKPPADSGGSQGWGWQPS